MDTRLGCGEMLAVLIVEMDLMFALKKKIY